jgi:glycosyltransferase involved in cell wall biosynthesis
LVSVVIPVLNGEDYLGDALASVASQTLKNLEIIVVDDGSTDGTAQLVARVGHPRLHYIYQQRSGAAAARNSGVEHAAAPLIAFLDADDLWLPDKLQRQVAALREGSGDMIFTQIEEFVSPELDPGEAARVRVKQGRMDGLSPTTSLIRRSDFQRVGPFNSAFSVAEFIDWFSRAEALGLKAHVVPEVLARRRVHRNNQTRLNPAHRLDYSRVVKQALDRRRARQEQS